MTLVTATKLGSTSILAAHDALTQALKRPLEVWEREAPHDWRLSEIGPSHDDPSRNDFIDADSAQFTSLLEQVFAAGRTCSLHVADGWDLLAAPLREYSAQCAAWPRRWSKRRAVN